MLFLQEIVKAWWLLFDSLFIIYDPVITAAIASLYKGRLHKAVEFFGISIELSKIQTFEFTELTDLSGIMT